MKRISPIAWDYFSLQFKYNIALGGKSDYYPCTACVVEIADGNFFLEISDCFLELHEQKENRENKEYFVQSVNNTDAPLEGFWVNKTWLQEWKKKNPQFTCGITEGVACSHGNLTVDPSNRKMVPTSVWDYLIKQFPDSPEYPSQTVTNYLAKS